MNSRSGSCGAVGAPSTRTPQRAMVLSPRKWASSAAIQASQAERAFSPSRARPRGTGGRSPPGPVALRGDWAGGGGPSFTRLAE
jgi:hypothetical protein